MDAPNRLALPRVLSLAPPRGDARAELAAGLLAPAAAIPPKFFYDELGCRLFTAITALPEYYPPRAEAAIFERHAPEMARLIGPETVLVDLGAGSGEKAARLFDRLRPALYVGVDIASEFLAQSLACLQQRFTALPMLGLAMDFSSSFALPPEVPAARRLLFYAGSSIGNFTPPQAQRLLAQMRATLDHSGALLIGVDLLKDAERLHAAYDDALGVTAAFNLNVLRHVNRLLGADFAPEQWQHNAVFNAAEGRVEMHLRARHALTVRWPGQTRDFAAEESIHTENAYKYSVPGFGALLAHAGLANWRVWTDPAGDFAVFLARPA